jgi:ABC-2 type transport system ATP-binding protein
VHPNFHRDKALGFLSKTKVRLDKKVRELSKGMIVQTHLAIVMSIDAKLLVLDEPTLGLDILYRKEFYHNLLTDYFDEERTILVTTHQVEEIEKILSDVMFIDDGKIVLDLTMEDMASRYVEVLVAPEKADIARKLGPMTEREVFGRHVFLYENLRREDLNGLGEYHVPSIADLFVAKMREGAPA